VSRTWSELLGDAAAAELDEPEQEGFFARLRDSLAKSRRALAEELASATSAPGGEDAWERVEEALIRGDVGVPATAELVRRLEARGGRGDLAAALAEEAEEMFGGPAALDLSGSPAVVRRPGPPGP